MARNHSFFPPSILIISWDPVTRSESEPFAWMEKIVQHYKDLNPDLYLDYIDLHQDILDVTDPETMERLGQARMVCLVINDDFEKISLSIKSMLNQLLHWSWHRCQQFLFTKKVQPVFTDWTLINSQKRLTKELASLEDET